MEWFTPHKNRFERVDLGLPNPLYHLIQRFGNFIAAIKLTNFGMFAVPYILPYIPY